MKYIGIDTGVNTGFAVWDKNKGLFDTIETLTITAAMDMVRSLKSDCSIRVYIEDPRLRKWFGSTGREKLQGAGSVKRDAKIWEDFCREQGIDFCLIPPKNNITKLSAAQFGKHTGWKGRTSKHARDAAMLVFNR